MIQDQPIPTDYRTASWEDFERLNDDEALTMVIERAVNHGWNFFGWWDRKQLSQKHWFRVFGGEILVYYNRQHTQERVEVEQYTVDDLVADDSFMQQYFGIHPYQGMFILEIGADGVERRVFAYTFHWACWREQQKEMESLSSDKKLKWLFASIDS